MDYEDYEVVSDRDFVATLLLCIFAGSLGIHHFYCRRIGKGIAYIFTLGFLGIGVFVDLILIIMKKYKDGDGRRVCKTSFFESRK